MKTEFVFNKIIFIESINPTKDPKLAIGDKLIDSLRTKITLLKSANESYNSLDCELIKVKGCEEFQNACLQISNDCEKGIRPIIHFICHGYYNEDTKESYMWLSNPTNSFGYEPISWSCVAHSLEKINIACHNNLLVTMCVCHGLLSLTTLLDDGHRIPYWCILSKSKPVSLDEGLKMLDFYIEFIQTLSLDKAIKHFKEKAYDESIPLDRQLSFTFADTMFTRMANIEFKKRMNDSYLSNRAIEFYKAFSIYSPASVLIDLYKTLYFNDISNIYQHIRDFKFMFDIYPEERERFKLPNTYDDLMQLNFD